MEDELPHHVEDKRIALLIAVLALCLAVIETGAKSAQTEAISRNVESNDTWSFYQARTVRQTVVQTAAELAELTKSADPAGTAAQQKTWRETAARWEDNPASGDGKKQLAEKARIVENERELAMARYHNYEYGAALLDVAIVVASASIVTGVTLLVAASGLLGLGGVALGFLGWLAPHALHF